MSGNSDRAISGDITRGENSDVCAVFTPSIFQCTLLLSPDWPPVCRGQLVAGTERYG